MLSFLFDINYLSPESQFPTLVKHLVVQLPATYSTKKLIPV